MELSDKIEAYLGRQACFENEVILRGTKIVGGVITRCIPYIDVWNISDKPKPTNELLAKITNPEKDHQRWDNSTESWTEDLEAERLSLQKSVNNRARQLLNTTDWKVIRHYEQKLLGTTTTLTEEEFNTLTTERANARNSVIEV